MTDSFTCSEKEVKIETGDSLSDIMWLWYVIVEAGWLCKKVAPVVYKETREFVEVFYSVLFEHDCS